MVSLGTLSITSLFVSLAFIIYLDRTEEVSVPAGDQLPPFWDKVPTSLDDFHSKEGRTIINPWNYLHRQGMYRILLEHSRKAMEFLGPNNSGNILWGLALQHGWQLSSKRLNNYDTSDPWNCPEVKDNSILNPNGGIFCISASSWWSAMNYNLNVVPFLGAAKAGLFSYWPNDFYMLSPWEGENNQGQAAWESKHSQRENCSFLPSCDSCCDIEFCRTVKECSKMLPKAMDAWAQFFTMVKNISQQSDKTSLHRSEKEELLLKYMWSAHIESITLSLPMYENRLTYFSESEQKFGVGWGHLVGFIAATRFSTNLNDTSKNQKTLPYRLLVAGDNPPHISDMSAETNTALELLEHIKQWDAYLGGDLERMWTRSMCSRQGRLIGRQLMDDVTASWWRTLSAMMELIWTTLWYPCDTIHG